MPKTITGASGAFNNTATVPLDTDIASGFSVEVGMQRLLDNGKALFDQANSTGVLAIRSVQDLPALKALTGMASGEVALVIGLGIYCYVAPSSISELLPNLVKPTSGTGIWVSSVQLHRGANYGLAYLGYDGRLDLPEIPNALINEVYFEHDENVAHLDFASTWTNVPNTNFTLVGAKVGDYVDFTITGAIDSRDTPGGNVYVRLAVGTGTTTVPAAFRPMVRLGTPGKVPFCLVGRYQVTSGDEAIHQVSWTVQQQAALYASGAGGILINTTLARLVRP